jgi:hypothetical protein
MIIIAALNQADLADLLFRWLPIALPFHLRLAQIKVRRRNKFHHSLNKIMFLDCVIGRRGITNAASSLWPCQKHYLKILILRRILIHCQGASKGANELSVPVDATTNTESNTNKMVELVSSTNRKAKGSLPPASFPPDHPLAIRSGIKVRQHFDGCC